MEIIAGVISSVTPIWAGKSRERRLCETYIEIDDDNYDSRKSIYFMHHKHITSNSIVKVTLASTDEKAINSILGPFSTLLLLALCKRMIAIMMRLCTE